MNRTLLILLSFFLPISLIGQQLASSSPRDLPAGVKSFKNFDPEFPGVSGLVSLSDKITVDQFDHWVGKSLKVPGFSSTEYKRQIDENGLTHVTLQQNYKGYPIENSRVNLHCEGSIIKHFNGTLANVIKPSMEVQISQNSAIEISTNFVDADTYKWQDLTSPINKIYAPKGHKCFYLKDDGDLEYCWKVDIYATSPLSRQDVYVSASSGEIVASLPTLMQGCVHQHGSVSRMPTDLLQQTRTESPASGTAITAYSGQRQIDTEFDGSLYRLEDKSRGNGIHVLDAENGESYAASVEVTDTDNTWDSPDTPPLDAHWGLLKTYDFLDSTFGLNSIDNQGMELVAYVHYDIQMNNAFWDGERASFGDGDGLSGGFHPLVSLDVVSHEVAHGLTDKTANLVYQGESGAINESMSDVMGTLAEFFAKPETANWDIGEEVTVDPEPLRSMSDPSSLGYPDTYKGNFWDNNEEVHTNSSIGNYWFYLITEGGTGTNDNGDSYNIEGLGLDTAGQIAYQSLAFYLGPLSDYEEYRALSIQATVDLYGACTHQVEQVTNAWYAVGVGDFYTPTVKAQFEADTFSCRIPATIEFKNLSYNADTFSWDFGNGQTSTDLTPSVTFNAFGDYDITLIAGGGTCGADTLSIANYVEIIDTVPCPVSLPAQGGDTLSDCQGILTDDGGLFNNHSNESEGFVSIQSGTADQIVLRFEEFNYESGFDYLEVYDGPSSNSPILGQFTGNSLPNGGIVTSTGSSITIKQETDQLVNESGFKLTWQCVDNSTPPAAFLSAAPTESCDGQVSFLNESVGTSTSWAWDFGDGTSSSEQNPAHEYQDNGTYTVKLVVCNTAGCDSITRVDYIEVDTTNGCDSLVTLPGDGVGPTQTSCTGTLYDDGGLDEYSNLSEGQITISPTGASNVILTFVDFGYEEGFDFLEIYDGPTTASSLIGSYTGSVDSGFTIVTTGPSATIKQNTDNFVTELGFVINWGCASADTTPVAKFKAIPTSSCDGEIQFLDESLSLPDSWEWTFGDGQTSEDQNPQHTYAASGTYDVQLIACNNNGCDTLEKLDFIQVNLDPVSCNNEIDMIANGTATTETGCYGFVHDDGGASGNYSNNSTSTTTIAPANSDQIILNFESFEYETGWDFLSIYDGINTSAPSLGSFSGTNLPSGGTITANSGTITLHQTTDEETTLQGFRARWSCRLALGSQDAQALIIRLFPNPGEDKTFVEILNNSSNAQVQILSVLGQPMLSASGQDIIELNTDQLSSGMYNCRIEVDGRVFSYPLAIK